MAKYNGNIPCMSDGTVHIVNNKEGQRFGHTVRGVTRIMLCGTEFYIDNFHGVRSSRKKYVYRSIEGVTCEKCKEIYNENNKSIQGVE